MTISEFDSKNYITAGVGIEYDRTENELKINNVKNDVLLSQLKNYAESFSYDYIEFQPHHFIFIPELYDLTSKVPILLHSLSLGSPNIPMDEEYLKLINNIITVDWRTHIVDSF